MLHESQYGDDKRLPLNSALSGRPLDISAGDVTFRVNGWRVGVKAAEWRTATPAQKAAAKARWAKELPARAEKAAATEPEYENMKLAELKALAKDRGIEVHGSSIDDYAQALRFADLQAQVTAFAPNTDAGAETALMGE